METNMEDKKPIRVFLKKNDTSKSDKIPYFTMSVPPEDGNGEWKDIGAFWKAKSGNGYSGVLDPNVRLDVNAVLTWREKKEMKRVKQQSND